ncbi:hypothetical protein [Promineifilum sp.]|uniref:hypothetical protein n=1 Tax=Promineifilum sp. TaxID=2664178 RepID=UPI0035AE1EB6
MFIRLTGLCLLAVLFLAAGCAPQADTPATEPATEPAATPTTGTEVEGPGTPIPAPTDAAPTDAAPADLPMGETPEEMFTAVLEDALARSGAERSAVQVVKSEQVEWSDGSLGCPQPDTMYTMAIINGYQVILDVAGQTYDYRLSDSGAFVLCD